MLGAAAAAAAGRGMLAAAAAAAAAAGTSKVSSKLSSLRDSSLSCIYTMLVADSEALLVCQCRRQWQG
jgi:hypothetical protein